MGWELDFDTEPEAWNGLGVDGAATTDEALRCPICGEFFSSAVSFPGCGHAYCALCIQRSLAVRKDCPSCRAPLNEGETTTPAPSLTAAAQAFSAARAGLLQAARACARRRRAAATAAPKSAEKVKAQEAAAARAHRASLEEAQEEEEEEAFEAGTTEDADSGDEWLPGREEAAEVHKASGSGRGTYAGSIAGKVCCPVCSMQVSEAIISVHVTDCLERQERRGDAAAAASAPPPRRREEQTEERREGRPLPQRKPTLVYRLIKNPQLKSELTKLGLSTKGDRDTLEARHKEFILRWNAAVSSGTVPNAKKICQDVQR